MAREEGRGKGRGRGRREDREERDEFVESETSETSTILVAPSKPPAIHQPVTEKTAIRPRAAKAETTPKIAPQRSKKKKILPRRAA